LSEEDSARDPAPCGPRSLDFHVSGRVLRAPYHAGETVLETARRADIPLSAGCEKGDCGACIVTVIRGAVRMKRNNVLSDDEVRSGLVLACQSLPDSAELAIDVF
jgi:3-ketosteroid 9alpha-monooxygenase subunit B